MLSGNKIISKIYLVKACHPIPVEESDDKELHAAYLVLKHMQYYLGGKEFAGKEFAWPKAINIRI